MTWNHQFMKGQDMDQQAAVNLTDSTASQPEIINFKFHAKASEYFRIWIVNLVLTIVTFGIYSAWAKVRTKKYLYGNVELQGARFDYHADPVKILKGRIIVGALFLGYSFGGKISWMISLIFIGLFALVLPWLLVRAMMFNFSNTSYRGIRFGFQKDYKGSYKAYIKGALITAVTLGLAFPYAIFLNADFRMNRIRFGSTYFQFKTTVGEYFKIYLTYPLFAFVGVIGMVALIFALGRDSLGVIAGTLFLYGMIFVGVAYIRAKSMNIIGNSTKVSSIRFQSDVRVTALLKLYVTNLLACIFTLGLAIPWAVIRTLRYRLSQTTAVAQPQALEALTADANSKDQNAAADAAADFWDIDLGF